MMDETDDSLDVEIQQETQQAIDGDRDASLALWKRVARGELNADVRVWLQHVADAVLDAESKPGGRNRDSAIVRAVGLFGKIDKHRELRKFVSICEELGLTRKEIVAAIRTGRPKASAPTLIFVDFDPSPYSDDRNSEFTDDEVGDLIDRELAKHHKLNK